MADLDIAPEAPRPAEGPRERRRRQTRDEILDAALAVVSEQGAAALNMSEVARRVGLRQPSLYQYFDSRLALYDALFERGMHQHLERVRGAITASPPGLAAVRAIVMATFELTIEQPALAQLLFRPAVPGFEPSEQAYRPSVQVQQLIASALADAVERLELHPAAAGDRGIALLVALTAGISALHLGNDQHAMAGQSRYLPLIEPAVTMFATYFTPDNPPEWNP